jgi:hypothetical protein
MAYNQEGQGPNQGKHVVTMFLHPHTAGVEQEPVWHCSATEGQVLQTYYGSGSEADFLECWLEVVDPPVVQSGELVGADLGSAA